MTPADLVEIELIKRVKYRYMRCLDQKLWDEMASCLADDAVASAYSLMDYTIAADLGGESAMHVLRERAWRRGIRMGSDMVPNHFGIDSTWVIHHPERFLSLDHPPYPGYTFNGPDLSEDPRIGVFIEDHYYTRSDAAVVFKRIGILIMPSLKETWGRTAVEAMASGVVVIHSHAEGLVECVGGAGIACDRDDENAWVDAINKLQGDRAYKEQIRQRGFKRVKDIELLQDQGRQELARRIENEKLY